MLECVRWLLAGIGVGVCGCVEVERRRPVLERGECMTFCAWAMLRSGDFWRDSETERERERERQRERERERVREGEREREKEREREREREREEKGRRREREREREKERGMERE